MHLAHNGTVSSEGRRHVLIVGSRLLYLEALRDLLSSRTDLSASLVLRTTLADQDGKPDPDVILLEDLGDESDDGVSSIASVVADRYPATPIVLLSARSAREGAQRAAELHLAGSVSAHSRTSELFDSLKAPRARPSRRQLHQGQPDTPIGPPSLSSLSSRELSVLRLVVSGHTPQAVAERLAISPHTVRTHLQNIMAKLVVSSRTELVGVALRSGMRPVLDDRGG